jgi:hypothetical protein
MYLFGRFCTCPHHQDHPAVLGKILDSCGLATIFPGLELDGLLYLEHFAGKNPVNNLC